MTIKVVQWATGAMGKTCLRGVIDHPDLELVGLYVYSAKKAGKDAGAIAHRDNTGVIATQNIDDILALDADVVIHTPRLQPPYNYHNDDICRLLASGKNVISINGHAYPQYWGESYANAFQQAGVKGNATLMAAGLNPGFIVEKIATAASGLCSNIDAIQVTEVVDCTQMMDKNYVFDILGFGGDCSRVNPNDPDWTPAQIMNGLYSELVALLVERLGFTLQSIENDHVLLPASEDIHMAAGVIKKGTASHLHWRWHGVADNRRLFTLSIHWVMETAHLDSADYPLWKVVIQGVPSVDVTIDLREPENHQYRTSAEQYAVAASVINSIQEVCSASPGILNTPSFGHFRRPIASTR